MTISLQVATPPVQESYHGLNLNAKAQKHALADYSMKKLF